MKASDESLDKENVFSLEEKHHQNCRGTASGRMMRRAKGTHSALGQVWKVRTMCKTRWHSMAVIELERINDLGNVSVLAPCISEKRQLHKRGGYHKAYILR